MLNVTSTPNSLKNNVKCPSHDKISGNISVFDEKLKHNIEEVDIVDLKKLIDCFNELACCRHCHHSLVFKKSRLAGLATKVKVFCPNCESNNVFLNCKQLNVVVNNTDKALYDINLRLVYAFR